MATLQQERSPSLPPAVRERIDALRAGIRRYVWAEGLLAVAVWLGLWFWASIAIDWVFEPPVVIREIILAAAGLGLAVAVYHFILRRAFVRLTDSHMAMVLERRFPAFNDSLLTTVGLTDRPTAETGFNATMLADTSRRAAQHVSGAPVGEVFDSKPLVRKFIVALGLAALIGALAWHAPDILELWAQRNLALADKLWPRKIRLEVAGFKDGVAKVAAGGDFPLTVRAFRGDTEIPILPERVEIRYRDEAGGSYRKTLTTIGKPASLDSPKDQVLQEYGYKFVGLLSTVRFDIIGGDARLSNLEIKVVPNPSLKLSLVCELPSYMERPPTTIEVGTDALAIPVGSKLTVTGTASKPLEMLRIDSPPSDQRAASHEELSGDKLRGDHNVFSYSFDPFPNPPVAKGKPAAHAEKAAAEPKQPAQAPREYTLQFTLSDTDGIKGRDPVTLNLVAVPDDPPDVKVRLVGTREPVVTTKGRVPATGKITDDHGIARAWWDYIVEQPQLVKLPTAPGDKPVEAPKPVPPRTGEVAIGDMKGHPGEYVVKDKDTGVEATDLKLAEGQKLTLTVRAADLCDLGEGPNVGSGESWQLEVVTEARLLTLLEARELLLRQRFEAIVQEMTETRSLLLKMGFDPPGKAAAPAPKVKEAGAEPGEAPAPTPELSAGELTSRRLERTLQALQNCHKNTLETAEVAAGVDEIRLQLTNNRVDSEERKTRLDANVSRPLHNIVEEMFPVFEKRLEALQATVGDLTAARAGRDKASEQAEAILAQMEEVLKHMMVMEDFNVAIVERLKKIIEQQKELNDATKKKDREIIGEPEKESP
jgi:hypothetical protein